MRRLVVALSLVGAAADEHANCAGWAKQGECIKNPGYMLSSCRKSCASATAPRSPWAERAPSVQHAIWPEVRLQTDGIGGHVVRGVWQIGAAHLLGFRLVCGPNLLFNGHMAREPPFRSLSLPSQSSLAAPAALRAMPSLPRARARARSLSRSCSGA